MAEVQDKLVDLKGLEAVYNVIDLKLEDLQGLVNALLYDAIHAPEVNGTIGQVLTLKDAEGATEWKDLPTSISEVDIRRIVNEQLAKTKYTINDQGHLIIETPEA